jgi:hypothetical protein
MIGAIGEFNDPMLNIANMLALVHLYVDYFGNVTGGNFHIVISDGNLEDGHIQFCIDQALAERDHVGVALGRCLLELSLADRKAVYLQI